MSTLNIEELQKKTVHELKEQLKKIGQPTSGKKSDLVERCYGVLTSESFGSSSSQNRTAEEQFLHVSAPNRNKNVDITYEKVLKEMLWQKDLRDLPAFDFVRLYDYLVLTTKKYDHSSLRTTGYKKLKAFQFFAEGHVKDMNIGKVGGLTYLKGEVLASMKQTKYKVVIVFSNTSEVLRAACKCPAG